MKFSQFNNLFSIGEKYLIHNTLENTAILIDELVYKEMIDKLRENKSDNYIATDSKERQFLSDLSAHKMLVPDEYDEVSVANKRLFDFFFKNDTLGLIILPTRQCNFRCPYCYEDHVNDIMIPETYEKVLMFIKTKIMDNPILKRVTISWFGGEPLLEYNSICEFMKRLHNEIGKSCTIFGSMTTNGYLLTPSRLKCLSDLNVLHYQITVDGMPEYHNTTRFLAGGYPTWETIITNLKEAKKTSIPFNITIRTNFSPELLKNASSWLRFLSSNFSDDKRFKFHYETVRDLGGKDKSFLNINKNFYQLISKMNKENHIQIAQQTAVFAPFSLMCYAAFPNSYVIDYNGHIKKCSVALDYEYNDLGELLDDGSVVEDEERLAWWTSYSLKESCYQCSIYPLCYGRKCPNSYHNPSYCQELYSIYSSQITSLF